MKENKMKILNFLKKLFLAARIRLILVTILMVCLPIMAGFFPAQAQPLPGILNMDAVDAYVLSQVKSLKIPGLALAIVQGDQVAYMRGYGQAGPGGRDTTPQTSFLIGSTSKSFTALAIMQLVEAGKINVDSPVQTYIPWFRTADPQASARITVQHLLNQTSGFSNATGLVEFAASDLSDSAIENSVRKLADTTLKYSPGATYEYSNINFTILGLIVQTVSGQSYESYMQGHIFDPLQMRHSFTSQDLAVKDGMAAGYVTWFGIPFAKDIPFNRGNLPGGFLICSIEDLGHYLIAQLNDGRYGNMSVLSPEGVAKMHQPAVPIGTSGLFYGMGWDVSTINGMPAVSHGGENANFSTFLLMIPEEKIGIAVLSNVNGESVLNATEQIAAGVLAVVKGNHPKSYQKSTGFYMTVGSALVPVTLSLLWIAWMMCRFIRRRKLGSTIRKSIWQIAWLIVIPLLVDLGLLWVLLSGLPKLWGLPLNGMALMFPSVFTLVIGSSAALAGWGVIRTILALRAMKPQPKTAN